MKESRITQRRKSVGPRAGTPLAGAFDASHLRNGITLSAVTPGGEGMADAAQGASATATVLDELRNALASVTAENHPRTFKLLQSGRRKLARKLIEEACEVTVEVVKYNPGGIVRESADLLYHLVALWFHTGINPGEVWREMKMRAGTLGLAEKLPKPSHPKADNNHRS